MVTIFLPEFNDVLDLFPDTAPSITKSTFDISNLSQRGGEISESLTVPASAKNLKLFNLIANAGPNDAPYKRINCVVRGNGLDYITGFLKVSSRKRDELELLIFGNQAGWIQSISDALISDLPRLPYSWTWDDVINMAYPSYIADFPLTRAVQGYSYDGILNLERKIVNPFNTSVNRSSTIPYHNLTHFVLVAPLFELIFKEAGYNVVYPNDSYKIELTAELPQPLFRRMALPCLFKQKYSDNWIKERLVTASRSDEEGYNNGEKIFLNDDAGTNQLLWYDGEEYEAGTAIEVDLRLQCAYRNVHNGNKISLAISYDYNGANRVMGFFVYENQSDTFQDYDQTVRLVIPVGAKVSIFPTRISGSGSGEVFRMKPHSESNLFKLSYTPTGRSTNHEAKFDQNGYEDSEMNLLARVGEIKQADLIKYLSVALGIFFETVGNTVYIREFKGIDNANNNEDWSKLIDPSEVEFTYELDGVSQVNFLEYDNDSDDLLKNSNPLSKRFSGFINSDDKTLPSENVIYTAPFSGSEFIENGFGIVSFFNGKFKDLSKGPVIDYSMFPTTGFTYPDLGETDFRYCVTRGANYFLTRGNGGISPFWVGTNKQLVPWDLVSYEDLNSSYDPKPRIVILYQCESPAPDDDLAILLADDFASRSEVKTIWGTALFYEYPFFFPFNEWPNLSLDFQSLIDSNSRVIKSAYRLPEVLKVRVRLNENDIQNLTQATAKTIQINSPEISISGVYLLNKIEQFNPLDGSTVVELIKLK